MTFQLCTSGNAGYSRYFGAFCKNTYFLKNAPVSMFYSVPKTPMAFNTIPSYGNHLIDLHYVSIDWFLYGWSNGLKQVKRNASITRIFFLLLVFVKIKRGIYYSRVMTILKFYQKKALAQVFSWEFCEIFKSTFCTAIFLQCFRKMGTLVFNE